MVVMHNITEVPLTDMHRLANHSHPATACSVASQEEAVHACLPPRRSEPDSL